VGTEEVEDDGISFEDKVFVIAENPSIQFANLLNYRKE